MFSIGVLWLCTTLYQMLSVSEHYYGYFEKWLKWIKKKHLLWWNFFHNFQKFDIHFAQAFISAESATLFMFIYCYCGNSITVNCGKITYAASQSCWYRYPVKYQHFIRHIIRRGQKPFYLTGYEIVKCSFETFRSVSLVLCVSKFVIFQNVSSFFFYWFFRYFWSKQLLNFAASMFMLLRAVAI